MASLYNLMWWIILLALFVAFIIWAQNRNKKICGDLYDKTFANQREMIGLLKEIRDLIKDKQT